MKPIVYDVLIVGGGPAGLTAAVYAARAGLKTLVFGMRKESGLWFAKRVENYPGLDGVSGPAWFDKAIAQAQKYGAEYREEEVVHAEQKGEGADAVFVVKNARGELFEGKALVLAVGKSFQPSGLENEEKFKGRGVHYCVACDGPFYKGKRVLVIGSGNYAAEECIELSGLASEIVLCTNGRPLDVSPELKKILDAKGVKIDSTTQLASFQGGETDGSKFAGVKTMDGKMLACGGCFVAVGTASSLAFAQKLGLELDGDSLVVNARNETNLAGVFAAGTCTGALSQIVVSAGSGGNAAVNLIKKLKGLENYVDHT